MKKRIIGICLAIAMVFTTILLMLSCGAEDDASASLSNTRDVYAMSALSSVAYLSDEDINVQLTSLGAIAVSAPNQRPDGISDEDVNGIENCISMFDGIIASGGIDQSVSENDSDDENLSAYKYKMIISLPNGSGGSTVCELYFNELKTDTKTELDDGEKEIEVSTTFEGVAVFGEELFVVRGEREVETEGKETEYSLEFRTYKNKGGSAIEADERNFVCISQSIENDEIEYEYEFFKNGKKVQEIELEYEEGVFGAEIEFQIKDLSVGNFRETQFKIKKGSDDNSFKVELEKNGSRDAIKVVKENGRYRFIYSNDFEENV